MRLFIDTSGGFAETGAGGQAIERRLAEIARETGIRLWGPNCMGLVDAVSVAILSYSGAAGILSADFLEAMGLDVADLSPATRTTLEGLFPDWMPVKNPVDLWPAMEKNITSGIDVIGEGLDALIADPNVDAVIVTTFAAPGNRWFDPDRAAGLSGGHERPGSGGRPQDGNGPRPVGRPQPVGRGPHVPGA